MKRYLPGGHKNGRRISCMADNPGTEIGSMLGEQKRPNILLIIVGALVFLLVVALGAFLGYTKIASTVASVTGTGGDVVEQRVRRIEVKSMISLEPFLVNTADIDSVHYIRATFQLGMADEMKEELSKTSKEMAIIRDSIVTLLSSKTSDEIMTTEGKETMREEIRMLVNDRYLDNRVAEVFITDLVVQ
jgi:flagellar FliL protein